MSNLRKEYSDIYDKYIKKIYRFVFLKVKSSDIAEDVCSEVFMRGWQSFKEQADKIENIQAFLYQIARNLLADHYRQTAKVRLVSVDYATVVDENQTIEEKAIIGSDLERIKAALANINEDYREVIIWYYLEELKVPEIAKMLQKPEANVRVLIHRALQSLKGELGEGKDEV
jgi:RNA polymerase sigma-70 factor, ECF subfamily